MKKIAVATVVAFLTSVVSATAMPTAPRVAGASEDGIVQVKAKKKMHHMSGKHMQGHKGMKGMGRMNNMDHMKGGDMKGMKNMDHMKDGNMKGMKGM